MNEVFYSILSGLDIVIGLTLVCFLLLTDFAKVQRKGITIGLFITAIGLIGQAICVLNDVPMSAPAYDQLWALKDLGIAVFTVSMFSKWIDDTFTRKIQ